MMKSKLITIGFCIILLLASCSKDKGCDGKLEYRKIIQKYKDLIPYNGNETLTFLHLGSNDTIIFNAEPTWTTYYNSSFSGIDCPIETKNEGRGIAFMGNTQNKKIVVNQKTSNNYSATLEIDFENNYFFTRNFGFYDRSIDTLIIQNHQYFNIIKFSNTDLTNPPTSYHVYFNNEFGILKFELENGETWELIY